MLAYNEVIQKQWQVETKMHSKQTDGYNYGVHCLLVKFYTFIFCIISSLNNMIYIYLNIHLYCFMCFLYASTYIY